MNKLTEVQIALSVANGDLWMCQDEKFNPNGYWRCCDTEDVYVSQSTKDVSENRLVGYAKPYKYTLDYLAKEIVHKGDRFVPIERLKELVEDTGWSEGIEYYIDYEKVENIDISEIPYAIIQKLQEWHFALDEKEGTYIEVTPDNNPYK